MVDAFGTWFVEPAINSEYLKLKTGSTKVRIISKSVCYYEYFAQDFDKVTPIRSIEKFKSTPWIKEGDKVSYNWTFKVYNYDEKLVQLLTVKQKGIKDSIISFLNDSDYGRPVEWIFKYDLKITKTGEKLDTKYSVLASPPKEFDKKLLEWLDLIVDWEGFIQSKKDIFIYI